MSWICGFCEGFGKVRVRSLQPGSGERIITCPACWGATDGAP